MNNKLLNANSLNKIEMNNSDSIKRKMIMNFEKTNQAEKQAEEQNVMISDGDLNQLEKTNTPKELQDYFNAVKDDITESTQLTYLYDYIRLKNLLGTKTHISNLPQKKILDAIKKTDKAKRPLLNIALVLFKHKDKAHNRLLTYREELLNERDKNQSTKNKMIIENANTTYNDLMDTLNRAKKDDYILFYLLINYNLRNLDLINRLIINTDELENKDDENYILYEVDKATLTINDYKTKASYGTKEFEIDDEKFLKILHNKYEMGDEYLFNNRTGRPYKQNEMGKYIKSRFKVYLPLSNLSQSTIYKIIQTKNEESGDIKALMKMSKNRGHALLTNLTAYSSVDKSDI
jgi:hypothetical protein